MRKFSRVFALLALMAVIGRGTAQDEPAKADPAKTEQPDVLAERVGLVFPFVDYGDGVILYLAEYTPIGEEGHCSVYEPVWYFEAENTVMPCPWELCPNDFRPPLLKGNRSNQGLRNKLHPQIDLERQVSTSRPQRPGDPVARWNPRRALQLRDPDVSRRFPTIQLGESGPNIVVRVWEANLSRRRAGLPSNSSGGSPVWRNQTPFHIATEVDAQPSGASRIVATKNPYANSNHQYQFDFDFDGTGKPVTVQLITHTAGK